MKHFHQAIAREDGMISGHAIYMREPEPLTVDEAQAQTRAWVSCDNVLCLTLVFTSASLGAIAQMLMHMQNGGTMKGKK